MRDPDVDAFQALKDANLATDDNSEAEKKANKEDVASTRWAFATVDQ